MLFVNDSMNGNILENIEKERRDLGIIVKSDLKVSAAQCANVVGPTTRILGMVRRTFTYRNDDTILNIYKTRPHVVFRLGDRVVGY
jgi:hypothetical protein